MGERLATDAFAFGDVSLRITRRDISGASASDADGDPSGVASDDEWTDPHFFDEDYSVAATTGFCRAWEGAEVLTRLMASDETLRGRLRGKRVVELGAGVGLCGLAAAAAGAHVMLTDLPAVVADVLRRNIAENRAADGPPPPTAAASPPSPSFPSPSSPWPGAIPIVGDAGGTAVAQALDWTRPVDAQLDEQRAASSSAAARAAAESDPSDVAFWTARAAPVSDPRRADLLLAAECLWLRELLEPFVDTALRLMTRPSGASACILSFRDRSTKPTKTPSAEGTTTDGVRTDDRDDAKGTGSSAKAREADADSDGAGVGTGARARAWDVTGAGEREGTGSVRDENEDEDEDEDGDEREGAFVPVRDVVAAFASRGCGWRTLAKLPSREDEGFHVHVFEISPPNDPTAQA
jgi:predicted nicotinamide N-methyase